MTAVVKATSRLKTSYKKVKYSECTGGLNNIITAIYYTRRVEKTDQSVFQSEITWPNIRFVFKFVPGMAVNFTLWTYKMSVQLFMLIVMMLKGRCISAGFIDKFILIGFVIIAIGTNIYTNFRLRCQSRESGNTFL